MRPSRRLWRHTRKSRGVVRPHNRQIQITLLMLLSLFAISLFFTHEHLLRFKFLSLFSRSLIISLIINYFAGIISQHVYDSYYLFKNQNVLNEAIII